MHRPVGWLGAVLLCIIVWGPDGLPDEQKKILRLLRPKLRTHTLPLPPLCEPIHTASVSGEGSALSSWWVFAEQ